MANKVIITKSKLNALGANMRQTHGLDHNPTIDEMAALALVPTGGSGGIQIPQVSNIAVDSEGVLSFDAPVIDGLTDYELEYIINVNGSKIKTNLTIINIKGSLENGQNTITIVCLLTFNDGEQSITIEFEKEVVINVQILGYTLPQTMQATSAAEVNGYGYIFGGSMGSNSYNTIIKQSLATDVISTTEAKLYARAGYTSAVSINGLIYIFGGGTSTGQQNYIQCYDPSTDTLTKLTTTLPRSLYRTSAVAINGKAYIFGGTSTTLKINAIYCYDPSTDTCTQLTTTLPIAISDTSAVVIDGKAYIFGGDAGASSYETTIYCFNPSDNSVTTMNGTLSVGLCLTSASVVGGKVYIFGGNVTYDSYTDLIHVYDPVVDACVVDNVKLPYTIGGTSAITFDKKTWIYCGLNNENGWVFKNTVMKLFY